MIRIRCCVNILLAPGEGDGENLVRPGAQQVASAVIAFYLDECIVEGGGKDGRYPGLRMVGRGNHLPGGIVCCCEEIQEVLARQGDLVTYEDKDARDGGVVCAQAPDTGVKGRRHARRPLLVDDAVDWKTDQCLAKLICTAAENDADGTAADLEGEPRCPMQ